jgi:glutaminyl-peptide cyclotransferase
MRLMRVFLVALFAFASSHAFADTPWTLVRTYPHDHSAFTEGLFFLDDVLYESTGQPGQSEIRKVRLKDGKTLARVRLDPRYFGEGVVNWGNELISVTWQHGTGFRWDRASLVLKARFSYAGEGWGLTQDGRHIIMSDGTPTLRFFDPMSMTPANSITVTWQGKPVPMLNELEYVHGEILANIWMTSRIARIDPSNGKVIDWIDLTPLAQRIGARDPDAVLNGIAYDAKKGRLFVTGKYWPKLFEISLRR